MTPALLRQLWSVVETTQAQLLLKLDDAGLVQWLLKQIATARSLNREEAHVLESYIQSRSLLIRDLARERLAVEPSR